MTANTRKGCVHNDVPSPSHASLSPRPAQQLPAVLQCGHGPSQRTSRGQPSSSPRLELVTREAGAGRKYNPGSQYSSTVVPPAAHPPYPLPASYMVFWVHCLGPRFDTGRKHNQSVTSKQTKQTNECTNKYAPANLCIILDPRPAHARLGVLNDPRLARLPDSAADLLHIPVIGDRRVEQLTQKIM